MIPGTSRNPCPGRKLEIFGNAPGEPDTPLKTNGIDELTGIPDPIKAIIVESGFRQIRPFEVARHDLWATDPQFEFFVGGHHL